MEIKLPIRAIYKAVIKDFRNGTFNPQYAVVEVLRMGKKRVLIELWESVGKKMPSDRLWVKPENLVFDYRDKESGRCYIYDLIPKEESCRACLQRCSACVGVVDRFRVFARKNKISL